MTTDGQARGLPRNASFVWRPDIRGGLWFYHAWNRLLSVNEYSLAMHNSWDNAYAADTNLFRPAIYDLQMWLTGVDWVAYVSAAATWVLTLKRSLWDESSYPTVTDWNGVAVSFSSVGRTAARWNADTTVVQSLVDATGTNSGTNTKGFTLGVDEQSGTATCYPRANVRYRLVAP